MFNRIIMKQLTIIFLLLMPVFCFSSIVNDTTKTIKLTNKQNSRLQIFIEQKDKLQLTFFDGSSIKGKIDKITENEIVIENEKYSISQIKNFRILKKNKNIFHKLFYISLVLMLLTFTAAFLPMYVFNFGIFSNEFFLFVWALIFFIGGLNFAGLSIGFLLAIFFAPPTRFSRNISEWTVEIVDKK